MIEIGGKPILWHIMKSYAHYGSRSFSSLLVTKACVALDVIEHLNKEDGALLLNQLERIAHRRVVVFTPNGVMPQGNTEEGDYRKHLAGWSADEMVRRGYAIRGADGWKTLRGEYHKIRFRPKWL